MEQLLAQGLVAGLLFIAIYMIGKRLTGAGADVDPHDDEQEGGRKAMFSIEGKQIIGAGLVAGLGSVGAQLLLTANLKPAATVFVQDPPF